LTIVGIGEDGPAGLGAAAKAAISSARHVFGGIRHLALAGDLIRGTGHRWPSPFDKGMAAVVSRRGETVCVLASGDPFWHGVGTTLSRLVSASEMRVFPAPSSFSLAAARLAWPLPEVSCLSLHDRGVEILRRHLQPGRRIIALTAGAKGPEEVARFLQQQGFGASQVTVLEAIGGPKERISQHIADDLAARSGCGSTASSASTASADLTNWHPLNVLAIKVAAADRSARVVPLSSGMPDNWFAHDGQISKRDIRALTISALRPHHGDLLWDIGAGSGAVAIEWMLAHPSLRAITIEANPARAAQIAANARNFGLPALQVVESRAPQALHDLAPPDAIFIGGGGTGEGMMQAAMEALGPGGRLVANAVTLEMESLLAGLSARHGGRLMRIDLSEAAPLGAFRTWRPALPITQWSWCKP